MAELEQLVRYPEVSNLLLSETADGDVLHQINRILGYMRQQQRPIQVSKAALAATPADKTAVAPGSKHLPRVAPGSFAQPADAGRGINANVILRSHRDDVILNIGEQLTHNNVRYTLYAVRLKDGAPEIVLQDSGDASRCCHGNRDARRDRQRGGSGRHQSQSEPDCPQV